MNKLAIWVVLSIVCQLASAEEWRFFDQVRSPTQDDALICHFWSVTIFAPGEKGTCRIGNIYTVDLSAREIRYAFIGPQGRPASTAERNLKKSTLLNALKGEGVERLEALRLEQETARQTALSKVQAERERSEYLRAFDDATTLPAIVAFELRYAEHDPDSLIPRLATTKSKLTYDEYRNAFENAETAAQIAKFISDYQDADTDKLIPQAKKRKQEAELRELAALQQQEKKRKQEALEQEAATKQQERAARQAAANRDRDRLQYIQTLASKYSARILAESPEAYSIVSHYKIDCRAADRRVLPLMNALFVSIHEIEGMGGELKFQVQNRGAAIRIYAISRRNGKLTGEPSLYYEINEWGELRGVGIRSEAVLNSCFGSHGPIWVMPGEPGY